MRTLKLNKKGVSPVIAVILMVAITVVLAAVLYVMVSNLTGGPGDVTPTVAFKLGKSGTAGALEAKFTATSIDVPWGDIKIIITENGTQETWSINTDCSAFEPSGSTSLETVATIAITDNAGSGCNQKISGGDYLTISSYTSGSQYIVKIFYINTEGIAGEDSYTP